MQRGRMHDLPTLNTSVQICGGGQISALFYFNCKRVLNQDLNSDPAPKRDSCGGHQFYQRIEMIHHESSFSQAKNINVQNGESTVNPGHGILIQKLDHIVWLSWKKANNTGKIF